MFLSERQYCVGCVLPLISYEWKGRQFLSVEAVSKTPLLHQRNQSLCFKTCPFLKAHCTGVPFWKGFSTLILSPDTSVSAEPLLLGLETFEGSSGTDQDYLLLRRWLWHNSISFFFFFFFESWHFIKRNLIKLLKAPCFQPFSHKSRYSYVTFLIICYSNNYVNIFVQGFILKKVSK